MKRYSNRNMHLRFSNVEKYLECKEIFAPADPVNSRMELHIHKPSRELFDYREYFTFWGCTYLWFDGVLVTPDNYMKIDIDNITDQRPVVEEENINQNND